MRATMLYSTRDVRVEERLDPQIVEPTDAVIRLPVTCVCGSDLWPYRGVDPVTQPTPMGHEYVGIVEAVGSAVRTIKPGQFVVGSFFASDNTCPICQAGYQSRCVHAVSMNDAIDAAYRTKYRRYAANIVNSILTPQARRHAATRAESLKRRTTCRSLGTPSRPILGQATGSPA